VADRTIDARKCISYLTIEHRGSIPEWIRPLMKNRIYGCDICQEVCPWNGKPKAQQKPQFPVREDLVAPKLETLLHFDDESFRAQFAKSPIKRAKREGFMRNVSIALGNWGTHDAELLLRDIIARDQSPIVQEHAQWALLRIH
jgi:epoxyqueuosine reductase